MSTIIGIQNTAILTADFPKVNNTLADTELTLPIAASQNMSGRINGLFTLAGAASGVKMQITVPAGGTIYNVQWKFLDHATPQIVQNNLVASASFSNALANASNYGLEIDFYILNGATAGNVTLQFAQNTTDAAAATLLKGAKMWVILY